jgi:hypothetical protein
MTDLLVTNLSGVNLALPAPLSGFLTYNQSKLFNNVDVNAVMQSARVGELVNVKKWLRLQ